MSKIFVLILFITGQNPQYAVNHAFTRWDTCIAVAKQIMQTNDTLTAACYEYNVKGGIGHA